MPDPVGSKEAQMASGLTLSGGFRRKVARLNHLKTLRLRDIIEHTFGGIS